MFSDSEQINFVINFDARDSRNNSNGKIGERSEHLDHLVYTNFSRLQQILSRTKSDSATSRQSSAPGGKRALPEFDEFILRRDYTGARTLLEVNPVYYSVTKQMTEEKNSFQFGVNKNQDSLAREWTAFCNFHLGSYNRAMEQYEVLRNSDGSDEKNIALNVAVCMFYLGIVDCFQFLDKI